MQHKVFFLVCISLTWLCTQHREAARIHLLIFKKGYNKGLDPSLQEKYVIKNNLWALMYQLITCAYCMGFWIGIVGSLFLKDKIDFLHFIAFGLVNAILSVVVCSISKE